MICCRHFGCWKVGGANSVALAGVSDKVVSYPYVLCALVELRVLCKLNSALVIDKDFLWVGIKAEKASKERTDPNGLLGSIRCANIFCFHCGECDKWLFVGVPGYGTTPECKNIARGRISVILIASNVCICKAYRPFSRLL